MLWHARWVDTPGMTVPAILTADEIKALVDYVFATFVQAPRP